MRQQKKQKILFDAQAIIDLHERDLWDRVVMGCVVCVGSIVRQEAYYHSGNQAINLQPKIKAGQIQEESASIEELAFFRGLLSDAFLFGIDGGEKETLALLVSRKRERYLFCTADALAIKCLGVLGFQDKGISMEFLLKTQRIKCDLHYSRKEKCFKDCLVKGFVEATLYKR